MEETVMPGEGGSPHVALPPFAVRSSTRAKRAFIKVSPHAGIEVVVPDGVEFDVEEALRARRDWLEESLSDIAEQREKWTADPAALLPSSVAFASTGEGWRVEYAETDSRTVRASAAHGVLRLSGAVRQPNRCLSALQRWLHRSARERLLPVLAEEAERACVAPSSVTIRAQRDRWAGCSHSGNITLNRALVFLELDLVRAVMRHELAHLTFPDHSSAFWDRLGCIDPDARHHRDLLIKARFMVPGWAERCANTRAGE